MVSLLDVGLLSSVVVMVEEVVVGDFVGGTLVDFVEVMEVVLPIVVVVASLITVVEGELVVVLISFVVEVGEAVDSV